MNRRWDYGLHTGKGDVVRAWVSWIIAALPGLIARPQLCPIRVEAAPLHGGRIGGRAAIDLRRR